MSELSESQYRQKLRTLIDRGIYDPDVLFRELITYYFQHDKQNDLLWDTQDDMEELFDAMADILAENFSGVKHGSPKETEDAKRFRKVRNWVENVEYNSSLTELVHGSKNHNPSNKFSRRMDALMHFLAGAAVSANFGEISSDLISMGVEVGDELKKYVTPAGHRIGYDTTDLDWGRRGSELQNAFDVSDAKARALAQKFRVGLFSLSEWKLWYRQPDAILYR